MPWLSVNHTRLCRLSAVPTPLLALEVQRGAIPGQPGANRSPWLPLTGISRGGGWALGRLCEPIAASILRGFEWECASQVQRFYQVPGLERHRCGADTFCPLSLTWILLNSFACLCPHDPTRGHKLESTSKAADRVSAPSTHPPHRDRRTDEVSMQMFCHILDSGDFARGGAFGCGYRRAKRDRYTEVGDDRAG